MLPGVTTGHVVAVECVDPDRWLVGGGRSVVGRENFMRGADRVKLFTTRGVSSAGSTLLASAYSREEIRTAVEEAERAGKYAVAHAHGEPGLRWAVDESVSTIEHGALASEEDIHLMIDRGAWLICTVSVLFHPTGIEQGDAHQPAIIDKVRRARNRGLSFSYDPRVGSPLRRWHRQHARSDVLGAGDAGALRHFEHGRAGGRQSPRSRGVSHRSRHRDLEPGKCADVIAIEGDPLADITSVGNVCLVLKDGMVV